MCSKVVHLHAYMYSFLFSFFSHIGYYRILSIEFPVLKSRSLWIIDLIYSSVCLLIPNSWLKCACIFNEKTARGQVPTRPDRKCCWKLGWRAGVVWLWSGSGSCLGKDLPQSPNASSLLHVPRPLHKRGSHLSFLPSPSIPPQGSPSLRCSH